MNFPRHIKLNQSLLEQKSSSVIVIYFRHKYAAMLT